MAYATLTIRARIDNNFSNRSFNSNKEKLYCKYILVENTILRHKEAN